MNMYTYKFTYTCIHSLQKVDSLLSLTGMFIAFLEI